MIANEFAHQLDAFFALQIVARVVIGENVIFMGGEETMRANGVQLEVLQSEECIQLMRDFIRDHPELWNEDIGV